MGGNISVDPTAHNRAWLPRREQGGVEVESAERPKALQQRVQDYLDAGTLLVWVIHSETNSATVYHGNGSARLLREPDALDGEDVLPSLKIPLGELFDESI
ncbi:MAG: Uma2 family endonuclease [Longimicrobiales bacterium]